MQATPTNLIGSHTAGYYNKVYRLPHGRLLPKNLTSSHMASNSNIVNRLPHGRLRKQNYKKGLDGKASMTIAMFSIH